MERERSTEREEGEKGQEKQIIREKRRMTWAVMK